MSRDLQADTREFIAAAVGTAMTAQAVLAQCGLEGHYDSELDLDTDLLDSELFECSVCGWWCASDEESEEPMVCNECHEAQDQD